MSDIAQLQTRIQNHWSREPGPKAQRYIGKFWDGAVRDGTIMAKVEGNHGTYTVSIDVGETMVSSRCSCYIGKHGECHHCAALAMTFLKDAGSFRVIERKRVTAVTGLDNLADYLESVTLDSLVDQLKAKGITQKAFAEGIGMSTRHLSAVKAAERRYHTFHELGATKLACLWVLEHLAKKDDEDKLRCFYNGPK